MLEQQLYVPSFIAYPIHLCSKQKHHHLLRESAATRVRKFAEKVKADFAIFIGADVAIKTPQTPIQVPNESQSQYCKRWFFFKGRPIHFHDNSTRVVWMSKLSKSSFSSFKITSSCPIHSVSKILLKLKSQLRLLPCCHKSETWSHLELRVLSSAWSHYCKSERGKTEAR